MIALNDETTTFKVKFHPFISTIDVVYDKSFRRELRYFARKTIHEKFNLSCFSSAECGDRYFSLFENGTKYAHCAMGDDSVLKFQMYNVNSTMKRCKQCLDVYRWTTSAKLEDSSSFPMFDFRYNLLLDCNGKAIVCRFIAKLMIEWIVEKMSDKSLKQNKKDLVMSIYNVVYVKKIYMLRIRKNGYWRIEHFDETFKAALTGFLM